MKALKIGHLLWLSIIVEDAAVLISFFGLAYWRLSPYHVSQAHHVRMLHASATGLLCLFLSWACAVVSLAFLYVLRMTNRERSLALRNWAYWSLTATLIATVASFLFSGRMLSVNVKP